jgi:chromosome segregation ATPase
MVGVFLGGGPVYFKLRSERTAFQQEIENLNQRFSLLRQKYSEEKARASGLLRTKATLEGETRALRADIDRLEKEKDALSSDHGTLQAECERKNEALEKDKKNLTEKLAALTSKHKELRAEHDSAVKEYDQQVTELTAEKNTLQFGVRSQTQKLERCRTHNGQLVTITNELLDKYQNKGVLGSAMEKEPFTGLKKVEMEHLIQEYQDKIETHQIESQQQQ